MLNRNQVWALLLTVLVSLPAATATWRGRGFVEPDTSFDKNGGFMFQNPTTTTSQVYFSAYPAYFVATVNHNLGTLGTQIAPYPTNIHFVLGTWRDCNRDGYIGHAESALLEYRAEILVTGSACTAVATPDPIPANWMPSHNDGQWVRELLWIGPDDIPISGTNDGCFFRPTDRDCTRPQNATNPYNIPDHAARVWADWGLPSDKASASCPVNPRPRGTYQSTGGFLRYADCFAGWRITTNVSSAAHTVGLHALAFDDAPRERPDQSNSLLNQDNPYGKPSGAPIVSTWDCSSAPLLRVDDSTQLTHQKVASPTTGQPIFINASGNGDRFGGSRDGDIVANGNDGDPNAGYNVARVNRPRAPVTNAGGSPAGTVNETAEGAVGDCNRENGAGDVFSNVYAKDEADFEGTTPSRVLTDIFGYFAEGTRVYREDGANKDLDGVLGRGRPSDLGEGLAYMQAPSATYWFGTPGYAVSRNPYVNRDDLQPWGIVYLSAYAWVNPNLGLGIPGGPLHRGIYGSQHCNGSVPITGGWTCDSSKWWLKTDGSPGRNLWQSVVGDSYNLQDIDCYDASASGVPSPTGTATGRACSRT